MAPNGVPQALAVTANRRVDEFEALRPHLLAVPYRLTGTVADAEDIVQDAWLRLHDARTPANGQVSTAVRVIHGPDKVARFLLGLARQYGPQWLSHNRLALVNGQLGAYTEGAPNADGYRAVSPRITAATVRDGRVYALWDVANPDKFTGSPLRSDPTPPTGPGTRHRN
jgi:hypothetical protein